MEISNIKIYYGFKLILKKINLWIVKFLKNSKIIYFEKLKDKKND